MKGPERSSGLPEKPSKLSARARALVYMFRGEFPLPRVTPVPDDVPGDKIMEWFENHPEEAEKFDRDTDEWERLFDAFAESLKP